MNFLKTFFTAFQFRSFEVWLRRFIEPLPTIPQETRSRCRLLAALLLSLTGIFSASLPLFLLFNSRMTGASLRVGALLLGAGVTLLLSQVARRGYYQTIIRAIVVIGSLMIFAGAALSSDANEQLIILQNLIIPMLFAALYLSGKAAVLVLGLQLIGLTLIAIALPNITAPLAFSQFRFHLGAGSLLLLMAHFYRRMQAAQDAYRAEQDARYRLAVENAQDAVYTLSPEGIIVSLNTAAETISGWPVAEVLGRPFADVVHPDDLPLAQALFQESLVGKKQPLFELRLRAKSGHYFQAELHSSPVIQGNRVIATTGVIRQIDERKRLEAELQRSERLSRTLIQHFPNGTVLLFDRDLRIQLVGGQTLAELGLSPEAVVGQTLAAALSPEMAELFEPIYRAALAGHKQVHEGLINGQSYWTQIVPIKNDQGEVIAGLAVSQNITRQKQAEDRFRTIFERSPDAVLILDSETTLIEDCNEVACQMNGYTHEELIGQPVGMLNALEVLDDKTYRVEMRKVGALRYETLHRHKNGTVFPVEVTTTYFMLNNREYIMGFDRDITERKHAENTLKRSEELYRTLARNFPNGIVALYGKDLRYIVVGGQGLENQSLTGKELLEQHWQETFPFSEHTPALVAALAGQTTVSELTHDDRHYVVHTLPVKDEDGDIAAGMVMLQDMTALKQAEAQRLQFTLERERLEMVNRFVLAISHEFRNSLAVIETARFLVERTLPTIARESIQFRLDTIHQTVARLTEQLDNLNTLSYLVQPHWLDCDLNALVEAQVLEQMPYARHKNVTLTFTPGRLKYPTSGDSEALRRALKQLILNALNYTPKGGSVQISTTSTRQQVAVVVKDTGIGIEAAQLPHIFDLFYRADPARALDSGGVGVGLSIARLIAEAHGGSITVKSEPGQGSTFKLTIPVRKVPVEPPVNEWQ